MAVTISGSSGVTLPVAGTYTFGDSTSLVTAGLTVNTQSGNYTLALADTGKFVYCTNAGAQTITVPTNASVPIPVGATVSIVNNGTTSVTIGTTGITMYWAGTANTGNRTLATKGLITVLKVATDTWFVTGAGLS